MDGSGEQLPEVKKDILIDEDVNECIKDAHSTLREIHQSIFQEQLLKTPTSAFGSPGSSPFGGTSTGVFGQPSPPSFGGTPTCTSTFGSSGNSPFGGTSTGVFGHGVPDVLRPLYESSKVARLAPFFPGFI